MILILFVLNLFFSLDPERGQFSVDSCNQFYWNYQDEQLKYYLDRFPEQLDVQDELWKNYYYAVYFKHKNNKDKQLDYLLKGLSLKENHSELPTDLEWSYLYEMGRFYTGINNGDKAIYYSRKALETLMQNNTRPTYIAKSYFGIGDVYYKTRLGEGYLDSALFYFLESEKLYPEGGSKESMQLNVAKVLSEKGKNHGVDSIYKNLLEKSKKAKHTERSADLSLELAKLYTNAGRFSESRSILDTLLDFCSENILDKQVLAILKERVKLADTLRDYKNMMYWQDSIASFTKDKNQNHEILIENYELEKQLAQEEAKLYRNRLWISVLGGTTGTLLLFLFGYNRYNKLKQSAIQQELETTKVQAALDAAKAKIEGEQKERRAIASVLHDKVASLLTAADVHLKVAGKKEGGNSLEKASEILKDVNIQVRDLSHQLVSPTLTRFGLEAALDSLVSKADSRDLKITLDSNLGSRRFSENKETFLYRSTTELLQNVMKHSNADFCKIKLQNSEAVIQLSISDNGSQKEEIRMGHGLTHISNRVEAFRGQFEIINNPGELTFVINLPITPVS